MKKLLLTAFLLMLALCCAAIACAESHTCAGGTATCDNLAVCATCGKTYGHLADHNWGSWVSDNDSTHTRTCQTNSAHKETRYHSGGASTCTQGARCVYCNAVHDAPLGHVDTVYPGYAATCLSAGTTDGVQCSRCGTITTPRRVISARGHSYNAWEPLTAGLHTALCTASGCGMSGTAACTAFTADLDGAAASVCPICGACGQQVFPTLLSRMDEAVPMGQLLVRGMAEPFPGALYAFTVTGSYAGSIVELDGRTSITLPEDLSQLPTFNLVRIDHAEDGTQALAEIPFHMNGGRLTFTADKAALYLLIPTE